VYVTTNTCDRVVGMRGTGHPEGQNTEALPACSNVRTEECKITP